LTGYAGQFDFGPERPGEVQNIYLDWSKAKQHLGWQPRMELEQGLRETVEYFRDRVSA
jgi:UDP-glucose 4-epimerase